MKGVKSVRVPGDGRAASIADAKTNGVPVHAALLDNLNQLAQELEISPLT